jgi:thioredoxin reductase
LNKLNEQNVEVMTGLRVVGITEDGVALEDVRNGKKRSIDADRIVLALGSSPVQNLAKALEEKSFEYYVIGDSQEPRDILSAVADGFLMGNKI